MARKLSKSEPASQFDAFGNKNCLNCDKRLSKGDKFCPACGQRRSNPQVSLWSLVVDFLEQQFSVDGKFFRTLKTLLVRPGQLTVDFCHGRRARYLSPIQIYLVSGVFFFLVFDVFSGFDRLAPMPAATNSLDQAFDFEGTRQVSFGFKRISMTSEQFKEFAQCRPAELRSFFHKHGFELNSLSFFFAQGAHQVIQPGGIKQFFSTYFNIFSQTIFVMMPVFGLFVFLLNWRSANGLVQTIVFSAHVHSFNYVIMVAISLVAFAGSNSIFLAILGVINFVYLIIASRRVFGGSYPMLTMKFGLALTAYMFSVLFLVILLLPFVFVAM